MPVIHSVRRSPPIIAPRIPLRLEASSNDSGMRATSVGNTLKLSGVAKNTGFPSSELTVAIDSTTIQIQIPAGTTTGRAFKVLAFSLPDGYELKTIKGDAAARIILRLSPAPKRTSPTAPTQPSAPPASKVSLKLEMSNDPTQRVSLSEGKLIIAGEASNRDFVPSTLVINLDGASVQIGVSGSAESTAKKLRAALPEGYKAVISPAGANAVSVTLARS